MSIYKYVKARVANPRRISNFGVELLHNFEGCKLVAYPDPGTGGKPYTIGFGTTVIKGQPVEPGMTITLDQAELYFEEDLKRFEDGVRKLVTVPISQNQFDALVSLTYNIGLGAFEDSTLLKYLNSEKYGAAADQFLRWNRSGGRVMEGLSDRRALERKHFLGWLK